VKSPSLLNLRVRFGEALSLLYRRFDSLEQHPVLWRIGRLDTLPLIFIGLLPLLVALPKLLGWMHADPMLYFGGMSKDYVFGLLPGTPYLDPNDGLTTQALGYRAALDWIHGEVPWWNPYSGVGLPLAAEYQPAAFFPLTLILLLPQGFVWEHLLLQMLAGWGTYGLLRQVGLGRAAALTGGTLFAFNGTLALFGHAPAFPVPFLPWMLWGVERAYNKTALGLRAGWRLFAVALAMSLLAGFPETAYVNGLLVAAWAVLRWAQTSSGKRSSYAARITLGGVVGIALCAPQILAFFEFLPLADIGGHSSVFGRQTLVPWAAVSNLVEPYAYWPLLGQQVQGLPLIALFSTIGGYVTLGILLLAVYEVMSRFHALNWLLFGWAVLALAKTFGIEPIVSIWYLIPGIAETAFTRYAAPSWEFALIVLAARGVDGLRSDRPSRAALLAAIAVLAVAVGACALVYFKFLHPSLTGQVGLQYFAAASTLWATLTGLTCLVLLAARPARWRQIAVATLLVVDSMLMYAVPTLCNPRGGEVDMAAIRFLQEGLGLQRFYSLGPIQPNYSAYFGIGSINETYMPIPRRWVHWVETRLDRYAHAYEFTGNGPRRQGGATAAEELRENIDSFESAGVKYVIASPASGNPYIKSVSSRTASSGNFPLLLQPGQTATGTLAASLVKETVTVTGMGVAIGNYYNTSDGLLRLTLCSGVDCETGARDLKQSRDNVVFDLTLAKPLQIASNTPVSYTITHEGGKTPVALWAFPVTGEAQMQNLQGPAGAVDGFGLQVRLVLSSAEEIPKEVYADEIMSIYQLRDFKPYFGALGGPCVLNATERTRVAADCETPATLIRREMFYPGWVVEINGEEGQISEYDDLFQAIALPKGKSEVRFSYAPPHVVWAWLVMWLGLITLCREGLVSRREAKKLLRRPVTNRAAPAPEAW